MSRGAADRAVRKSPQADQSNDWEADHALLVQAAREGGALALKRFRTEQRVWRKGKSAHNRVCEADIEVDALLRERLTGARPRYGWLSEESGDDPQRLTRQRVWVVDPIDGTNSYLKGIPEFAVAVALVEHVRPVAAAVFNPARDELFEAKRGQGARLNGSAIAVSETRDLGAMRLLASRSEHREAGWPRRFGDSVHAMSSIAYKLALVAGGTFDATASLWPKSDWDICAGDLLVQEAGGRMTSATGSPLSYNRAEPRHQTCLATNGYLHNAVMADLREAVS